MVYNNYSEFSCEVVYYDYTGFLYEAVCYDYTGFLCEGICHDYSGLFPFKWSIMIAVIIDFLWSSL